MFKKNAVLQKKFILLATKINALSLMVIIFTLLLSFSLSFEKIAYSSNNPPFWGTVWVNNNILNESDPSTLIAIEYKGIDERLMFDRRLEEGWKTFDAFLFDATFSDGLRCEIQVNPEFDTEGNAFTEAEKYGFYIGKLPTGLRTNVETVWIHKGDELFGGGNNNLLIHTDAGEREIQNGWIEEILIHEAAHTSLDPNHADSKGWLAAQEADGTFISTYAKDYPEREDIAESFLMYFAVRYKSSRIPDSLKQTVLDTIPNRIEYFDSLDLDFDNIIKDVETNTGVIKSISFLHEKVFKMSDADGMEIYVDYSNVYLDFDLAVGQKVEVLSHIHDVGIPVYPQRLRALGVTTSYSYGNIEDYITFDESTGTITDYHRPAHASRSHERGPADVVIPEYINGVKVEHIGNRAFNRKLITSVVIPDTVKTIGPSSFASNANLTKVDLGNSLERILTNAFAFSGLKEIYVPDSVIELGPAAFYSNNIETVRLPETITKLLNQVFRDNNIKKFTISNNIQSIDHFALGGNEIEEIVIPEHIKTINPQTFSGNSLRKITLGDNVSIKNLPVSEDSGVDPEFMKNFSMGIDVAFTRYYNGNNKKGGTYELINGNWTYKGEVSLYNNNSSSSNENSNNNNNSSNNNNNNSSNNSNENSEIQRLREQLRQKENEIERLNKTLEEKKSEIEKLKKDVQDVYIDKNSNNELIRAVLTRNISVSLNGRIEKLFSGTGERVHPIVYNGSSYLPVRAIANLAGLNVDWDAETRTVILEKEDDLQYVEPWKDGVID